MFVAQIWLFIIEYLIYFERNIILLEFQNERFKKKSLFPINSTKHVQPDLMMVIGAMIWRFLCSFVEVN